MLPGMKRMKTSQYGRNDNESTKIPWNTSKWHQTKIYESSQKDGESFKCFSKLNKKSARREYRNL